EEHHEPQSKVGDSQQRKYRHPTCYPSHAEMRICRNRSDFFTLAAHSKKRRGKLSDSEGLWFVRRTPCRPGNRSHLQPAAESSTCGMDIESGAKRQTRFMREAHYAECRRNTETAGSAR